MGKKTVNSRQRRKRKREEGRNTLEEAVSQEPVTRNTSEEDVSQEPVTRNTSEKAVSQEPVNALLKSVEPVTRTAFNKQNTLTRIKKREDDNLWNESYFYFDISRQKAIEILKTRGNEKEFLLRESYKETHEI